MGQQWSCIKDKPRLISLLDINVVLVDAIDKEAKSFYLHYGIIELPGHELKLFLPIETIDKLFG